VALLYAALHRIADDAMVVSECALYCAEAVAGVVELAVWQLDEPRKVGQPLLRAAAE
jgi:hypothetical protein